MNRRFVFVSRILEQGSYTTDSLSSLGRDQPANDQPRLVLLTKKDLQIFCWWVKSPSALGGF